MDVRALYTGRYENIHVITSNYQPTGDGSISFDEFANLMRSYQSYQLTRSCDSLASDAFLRETFEVFDKDHDGYLNAADLRFPILLLYFTFFKRINCGN